MTSVMIHVFCDLKLCRFEEMHEATQPTRRHIPDDPGAVRNSISGTAVVTNLFLLAYPLAAYFHKLYGSLLEVK